MEVMNQGDKYEEDKTDVLEDPKPKIPKKLIVVGIVVAVIGVILASLFGNHGSKPKPEVIPTSTPIQSTDGFTSIDGTSVTSTLTYSDDDKKILRDNGYTGDDIEKYQKQQIPVQSLVDQAAKGREDLLKKTYVELSDKLKDSASPEYKKLLSLTWLSGKPVTVTSTDPNKYTVAREKENCRYVKVPSRGEQLFVELTLDSDGQGIFLNVTPQRYAALKDDGNMVINYDRVQYGSSSYVTNIVEVVI